MKLPAFVATINRLKFAGLEATRSKLQSAAETAADTLIAILSDDKNPEIRRKAALDILRMCGLEPGKHESYGWGIGPRTPEKVAEEEQQDKILGGLMANLGY